MTPTRRWLAMVSALGAAAAFALAVQGSAWWTIGADVGIGTVSSRHCFGEGGCQVVSLGWTDGSDMWMKAGGATYAAGLVAAVVLVALAGALAARSSGRLAAASAAIATVCAVVVAAIFVTSRPLVPGAIAARGMVLFAAAVGLALVAIAATLWRARRTAAASPPT